MGATARSTERPRNAPNVVLVERLMNSNYKHSATSCWLVARLKRVTLIGDEPLARLVEDACAPPNDCCGDGPAAARSASPLAKASTIATTPLITRVAAR